MSNSFRKIVKAVKGNLTNYKQLQFLHANEWNDYKSVKVNQGQLLSTANAARTDIRCLADVEFRVFSQFGDDGIIQWLISKIPLPNNTFVEFGVEDYRESNTRFLLVSNYWSGLVIDGNAENIQTVRGEQLYTFFDLQAECSFITKANINSLIQSAKFDEEVGILSVDIDGNDYWIWKEINCIKPVIVITEYNSLFGFEHPHTISYSEDFVRGVKLPFNFYGVSLRSACDLAEEKGYSFIGCNGAGNNAYFVRNDYLHYLPIPALTAEEGYVFASFTETWDEDGIPKRGIDKVKSFHQLPVVNTRTGDDEKVDSELIANSLIKAKKLNRF